jgi:Lrp/AsnC family leucine-responsive transcriptional regulator
MAAHEAVLECHHVTGNWSYLVKLRLANMPALEEFVSAELRTLPGLERLAVDVALSSIKETSLLPVAPEDEEGDE